MASRPLIPGRFTSIKTRSGFRTRAVMTESSPVAASPTTSKPSVNSTTIRATARNGSWSSTMSTRTVIAFSSNPSLFLLEPKTLTGRDGLQGCRYELPGRLRGGRHPFSKWCLPAQIIGPDRPKVSRSF